MVPDPHPETNNLTFEVPGLNQISNKRNDQVQRFGLEINSETFLALPHQLRKIISSFIANIFNHIMRISNILPVVGEVIFK